MRAELYGVKKMPENLALNKQTGQSSTFTTPNFNPPIVGGSEKAVDGNSDTDFNNGHCTHTFENNPSWWRVDLGSDRVPVAEVHIVNRLVPPFPDRNEDYNITVGESNTVTNNPQCVGLYSFIDFTASAVCFKNPLMTGRYVGIMTTKQQFLQLCEVEVYSRENLAFNKSAQQSSQYNNNGPGGAVDGNTARDIISPCTHTAANGGAGTSNPWWMVDLGTVEPVSELYIVNRGDCCGDRLSGFEIRVGTDGSNGGLSNPKCGDSYSVPQGKGSSFYCRPSLLGRYVTINIPGNGKMLTLCEIEVYSERRACHMQSIGLISADIFPDAQFSAPSSRAGNEPSKGRLTGAAAWAPNTNSDPDDYLQINLGYDFYTCAVATRGNPNADEWTTNYKILFSLNGSSWNTYQENNADEVFDGNSGRNDIVKHSLSTPVKAKFIRVQPTASSGHKALRVEVYGTQKPRAPSQPPDGFSVNPVSSTSVQASWQLPPENARHGTITGFKLIYRDTGSSLLNQLVIDGNTTLTKDISGLSVYTEYEFQVLAFSSAGDGKRSEVQTVITHEDEPSGSPTSFTVTVLSSTSVRASWQLPSEDSRNGVITGFKLFYKKKDLEVPETAVTINSGSTLQRDLTNLGKYTEYEFQVLAFTSVGNGPRTAAVIKRTQQDVPTGPPTSFTVAAQSSTSVRASWQLPSEDSRNGAITGFKLFYKRKDSGDQETSLPINSGSTRHKDVTGLRKYTKYEFQVLAFTSIGDGPRTAVVIERTQQDAPSAPTSLAHSITPPSDSKGPQVTITWQKPQDENGIITVYNVFYSHSEDPQNVHIQNTGKDTLTYTADVLGGVTYQFNVRAVTIAPGPNASLSVIVPQYRPSVGPDNISSLAMNSTTFNITWSSLPRDKAHGMITLYEVKQSLLESCITVITARNTTFNSTTRWLVLNDLYMCSQYEVSVRAYTTAGFGPYGSALTIQTLGFGWAQEAPTFASDITADEDGITAKIKLPRFPRGALYFQVIVIAFRSDFTGNIKTTQSFVPDELVTYEDAHESSTPSAYVTFQFGGNEFNKHEEFIIGNGIQSNSTTRKRRDSAVHVYSNKPLQLGTSYRVFLRAFTTESMFASSAFVEIDTSDKPVIRGLQAKTTFAVGQLGILTCEVSGNAQASITWTKDGNSSIPRAQFRGDGKVLAIQKVVPQDQGVYECTAKSHLWKSSSHTSVIITEPPRIPDNTLPITVLCKTSSACSMFCYADSDETVNYTWTKNGTSLSGSSVKIINNTVIVTPQGVWDYGIYVCHAADSMGDASYEINLVEVREGEACNTAVEKITSDSKGNSVLLGVVIGLSSLLLVVFIVIVWMIFRLRKTPSRNTTTTSERHLDNSTKARDAQQPEQDSYMELSPRSGHAQHSASSAEYQTLQKENKNPGHYNLGFNVNRDKESREVYYNVGSNVNKGEEKGEIYEEIGNASA